MPGLKPPPGPPWRGLAYRVPAVVGLFHEVDEMDHPRPIGCHGGAHPDVAGHRGQVGVSQTPQGGATFIVRLPLAAASGAVTLTANSQAHISQ